MTLEPRWRGLMAMSPPSRSQFKDTPTDLINVNGQTQLSVTSVLVHSFDTFSFSVHLQVHYWEFRVGTFFNLGEKEATRWRKWSNQKASSLFTMKKLKQVKRLSSINVTSAEGTYSRFPDKGSIKVLGCNFWEPEPVSLSSHPGTTLHQWTPDWLLCLQPKKETIIKLL